MPLIWLNGFYFLIIFYLFYLSKLLYNHRIPLTEIPTPFEQTKTSKSFNLKGRTGCALPQSRGWRFPSNLPEGKEGERGGGGGRDTVTCRRTHMVLLRRNTNYRDRSDPGRSRSPRQGLSASIINNNNNNKEKKKTLKYPSLLSFISPHPSSCRPPPSVALGPVKERHGSGERRPRQRRDVEKTSGRHQENLWFQRSPGNVST